MPRRRRHEEHENHERWLVSYADFITLLFAFFVVMYSTSSVNEGKYRVLSDSLTGAFSSRDRSCQPIQMNNLTPPGPSQQSAATLRAAPIETIRAGPDGDGAAAAEGLLMELGEEEVMDPQSEDAPAADSATLARKLSQSVLPEIDEELVELRLEDDRVEIELKTSILFSSGSARLVTEAIPILEQVATVLKSFPNPVQVEGFTDNVPIRTLAFPSNWELSASRAASVVHLFAKYGVRPERMTAIGYGEYSPVADNDTAAGRKKNRRVVVVIPAGDEARKQWGAQQLPVLQDAPGRDARPQQPALPAPSAPTASPLPAAASG